MSPIERETTGREAVHREDIIDVRIVELHDGNGTRYRFEAPRHRGIEFDSDAVRLNEEAYDFNENGRLDFDDVVALYEEI